MGQRVLRWSYTPTEREQVMARKVPNTDPSITPVIFRKFRDGEVIALFPYVAGNTDGWTCESFMHVGQHGSADPHIVGRTALASEVEAHDLIVELTSGYGYRPLRILRRFPADSAAVRRAQVTR